MRKILIGSLVIVFVLSMTILGCKEPEVIVETVTETVTETVEVEKEEEATVEKAETGITIGLVVEAYGNQWFGELIEKAEEVAEKRGVTLVIGSSEWDPAKETQIFDDFIQREMDAICVCVAQEAATRANLWKAAKAGIPCVTMVLEIRGAPQCTVIKHDNYVAGYDIGVWAANYFVENRSGEAKLAMLDYPIYQSVIDRCNGFKNGFQSVLPNAEVVSQQSAEGLREKGMTIMENIIQANPDVNVVFGANDDCALGAASAVEAAGMDDVIVCGFDGTGDAKTAIRDGGVFKASILTPSDVYGETIVNTLADLAEGNNDDVTFWNIIPHIVINPDNIDQY